ncbi:MAG: hydroxymethylglutaryl-CoA lyase [Pseudomonadota bacterium]
MVRSIEIVEVGARDGLQNEAQIVETKDKIELIMRAIGAGAKKLEVASFVHPKRVPQMADAEAVVEGLPDGAAEYVGLALNMRGAQRALETKVDEIGCVAITTDSFATRNQGQTSDESVDECKRIIRFVHEQGRRANVTISTSWGCPFEGEVEPERVVEMATSLAEAGPVQIAIADTIGVADPWRVKDMFERLRDALPQVSFRAHFHNTRNTGIANAFAAVQAGVDTLDASLGGLGGCPFAPNATGNIPTEDLIYMLNRGGIETGWSAKGVAEAAAWVDTLIGDTPGMLAKAGVFPDIVAA